MSIFNVLQRPAHPLLPPQAPCLCYNRVIGACYKLSAAAGARLMAFSSLSRYDTARVPYKPSDGDAGRNAVAWDTLVPDSTTRADSRPSSFVQVPTSRQQLLVLLPGHCCGSALLATKEAPLSFLEI